MTRTTLESARVLIIIGGGIAAYKSLELIRRLRDRGSAVRVVMTKAAGEFVKPLAAATLSGKSAREDLFSLTDEALIGHIELSRAADLIVVAPATANLIARMAGGIADDLATTVLLATDKPVLVAPAMNVRMWSHPATRRNMERLRADGVLVVGPDEGPMACGEFEFQGRMAEPPAIVEAIESALATAPRAPGSEPGLLAGRHVVVTSGPTLEAIDPVRFLGNRSSGRQGHAVAQSAVDAGARVTLVSGPVALADPRGASVVHVESAREMQTAVEAALPADVFVGAAAVADWRIDEVARDKIKKDGRGAPRLNLVENPDILREVSRRKVLRPALVIGFAAETEDVTANAKAKLERKGCDWIVANSVASGMPTFGGETNEVTLIDGDGVEAWPRLSKAEVADRIIRRAALHLAKRP